MLKKVLRRLALFLVPFLGSVIIRFLYFTNKKKFHAPQTIGDEQVIVAFWHGELLMAPYAYLRYRKPKIKVLISDHFDGALIANTMKYFGFETIRGSSNKNAARTLIQSIKELKNGYDLGITPDGPKGPRHEVADGIIVMAQKTKAKIMIVEIKPSSFWQLSSWDKFVIPKPFGTIDFYISDLIDISNLEFEQARDMIKEGLLKHEN